MLRKPGSFGSTTGQRGLAALEAGALAATGAGLLAVHTAAGGLALTGSVAAADALAVLLREPSAGSRSLSSILFSLQIAYRAPARCWQLAASKLPIQPIGAPEADTPIENTTRDG